MINNKRKHKISIPILPVIIIVIIAIMGIIFLKNKQESTTIGKISGKSNNYYASTTTTINGITYVTRTETNSDGDTLNRATVTSVKADVSADQIMGKESGRVYLSIPQKITIDGTTYIVDTIGDGSNNVLTTSVSSGTSFAQLAGQSDAVGDIYIVLPKSIRTVKAKAFSNCYGANDSTAIMVSSSRNVVLVCLPNEITFESNSTASQTVRFGVRGSGAENGCSRFYDLYTYTKSGNTIKITGCNNWGTDKIFDKLGSSARFYLEIPQYIKDESGKKYVVTEIGDSAFANENRIQRVVIPATMNKIGSKAFYNCTIEWVKSLSSTVELASDSFILNDPNIVFYGMQGTTTSRYAATISGATSKLMYPIKITIVQSPKTSYKVGEKFSADGLVLNIKFRDADGWIFNSDIIYGTNSGINLPTSVDTSTVGTKSINVNYGASNTSASTSFNITVSENLEYKVVNLNKDGGTGGTDQIRACSNGILYVYDGSRDINEILKASNDAGNVKKLAVPTKSGYKFLGYYTGTLQVINETGHLSDNSGAPNGNYLITHNVSSLTAKWEQNTVSVTGVTLNKNTTEIVAGGTETLIATITPNNATNKNVTWTSSNPSVATVDQNGKVTAIKAGNTTITVTTQDGGKTATCIVTVKQNTVPVIGITLNKNATQIVVGGTETLIATITPNNATNKNVTWTSSNPAVATVDQNGKVTAIKEGNTTITVTTQDGGKTATCTVTVKQNTVPVTGITLNKTSEEIEVGATIQLKPTITPNNATNKNVTWTSSNPEIATVTNQGIVTGIKPGKVTITATTEDGGKTAICEVTVKQKSSEDKDTTPPIIEKTETGKDKDGKDILYITVTDKESGINKVLVNGKDITDQKTDDGRYWYELVDEGDYKIEAIDNAGNKSEKVFTWKKEDNSDDNNSDDNKQDNNNITGDNSSKNQTSNNKTPGTSSTAKDGTTIGKIIPKTGGIIGIISMLGVVTLLIFGIISIIKYKKFNI